MVRRSALAISHWPTAHGDLHAANVTCEGPWLFDFEGFGRAPADYDPAMLLLRLLDLLEKALPKATSSAVGCHCRRFSDRAISLSRSEVTVMADTVRRTRAAGVKNPPSGPAGPAQAAAGFRGPRGRHRQEGRAPS